MNVICGYSTELNATLAVEQATVSIEDPKMIIFYCNYSMFEKVTELLHNKYPNCEICGATTAVAYQNDMNWDGNPEGFGLSVTSYGDDFECKAGCIADVNEMTFDECDKVSKRLKELGTVENTVCFEIMNVTGREEDVVELLSEAIRGTGVRVVGGLAGHDEFSKNTLISYNGNVYNNGCVYVFIHNKKGGIKIVRGDICTPTRRTLIATDVDIEKRIVYEFDGIPAAEAIANELNVSVEKIRREFWKHPIGRIEGDELNIVEVLDVTGDNGVKVAATVYGGVGLKLLEHDDYEERIYDFSKYIAKEAPHTGFCMMVIGRTVSQFLKDENWIHKMTKSFDGVLDLYVGLSGWGEQLDHLLLNQSILAIAFQEQ